jgi:integrase/recombinase XerD
VSKTLSLVPGSPRRMQSRDYAELSTMQALALADRSLSRVEQRDFLNAAASYLASLSETGARSQETNLRRVLRIFGVQWDDVKWGNLRFDHVDIIKRRLQKDGYAPNTINATLSALKGTAYRALKYGQMRDEDYRAILEVRGVRGLRVRVGRRLTAEEVEDLMIACAKDPLEESGHRDALIIALLVGAGLRRSEAVALCLEDWDEESHALHVQGKGDRDRLVYIEDGGARRALHAWLKARGPMPGALLCPITHGGNITIRHLHPQAIYQAVRRRAREAGTRPFAPHDLRRTCATNMLEGEGDVLAVSKYLGHMSVETTRIYDMRGEEAKKKVARIVHVPYHGRRKFHRRRRRHHRK